MSFKDKLSKRLEKATLNVEQTKMDIMSWAMDTGENTTKKKKFNVFYYSLFGIIFGVGMYYDWMSLKLIGGVVLVTSFVGWIYANIKSYFNG
jgi:hypothetical protein